MELVLTIGIAVLIIVLIFCLLNMARDKRYHDEYMKMLSNALAEKPDEYSKKIAYTDEFLKYLDTIIASASNITFRQWFSKNKNTEYITRIKIQQLVDQTSRRVFEGIITANINHDALLVTNDYWTWYIVNLTIALLNEKFEKALIQIIDEGGNTNGGKYPGYTGSFN